MSGLPPAENTLQEISLKKQDFYDFLAKARGKGIRPIPNYLGTFGDGARFVVYDQYRNAQFYLVTDLTNLTPNTGSSLVGIVGSTGARVSVSASNPTSLSQKLAVALSSATVVGLAGAGGPSTGQTTLVANTVTQLNAQATVAANMAIRNLTAATTVEIGPTAFTLGTGYQLTATGSSTDNLVLRWVIPANIYVQSAGTPTVAWLID